MHYNTEPLELLPLRYRNIIIIKMTLTYLSLDDVNDVMLTSSVVDAPSHARVCNKMAATVCILACPYLKGLVISDCSSDESLDIIISTASCY